MKNYVYYDAYHRQRRMPGSILLRILRVKRGIFLMSFFIALILGKLLLWDTICQFEHWNENCMGRLNLQTLDQKSLFFYLLLHRGELLALLILCGITKLRKVLYHLICGTAGCFLGIVTLSFCHSFRWRGICILVISLIPHWIVYGILYVFLYWIFIGNQDTPLGEKPSKSIPKYALYGLGVIALLFAGIYLECFVNPILLSFGKTMLNI